MNQPTQEQIEAKAIEIHDFFFIPDTYSLADSSPRSFLSRELAIIQLTELAALQEQLDNDITSLQTQLNHERSVNDVLKAQLDKVKRERDEAILMRDSLQSAWNDLNRGTEELNNQLAVARKDSERLDWLDINSIVSFVEDYCTGFPTIYGEFGIRKAIDAAMEKGGE